MTNGTLAIYDSDIHYLHHLSEYLRSREDFPYDIIVFSDLDALNKYSLIPIDILITSVIPEFIKDKYIGDIFYLSSEPHSTYKDYVCLYKFQPADMIVRKIMEHSKSSHNAMYRKTTVIGIYSPINGCGKSSFSISLGHALSEQFSTLLLSFDTFSFLSDFVDQHPFRDISDLLFFYRESTDTLSNKLLSLSYKFFDLNFLCPPATPKRIKSIPTNDWCSLIESIAQLGLYNYIIIDISNNFFDADSFFKLCDMIFLPTMQEYPSCQRINNFYKYLDCTSEIDPNIFKKVCLPSSYDFSSKDSYINWITRSQLYSYAKNIAENICCPKKEDVHGNSFC